MQQKYVVIPSAGGPSIIIFPAHIRHDTFQHLHPTSAGFLEFFVEENNIEVSCYGESDSLKLKSNPEKDSALATREFKIALDFH